MVDPFTYQTGKIGVDELCGFLDKIYRLEERVKDKGDSIKFGDSHIVALNGLRTALPETFTREELIGCYRLMVREIRGERDRLVSEEVEERLSDYVGRIQTFLDQLGK